MRTSCCSSPAPEELVQPIFLYGAVMSFLNLRRPVWAAAVLALGVLGMVLWRSPLFGAEPPVVIAPPAVDNPKAGGPPQTAVLAGGCFWGVQGVFEHVRGVQKVIAGYAGGDKATAQY